MSNSAAEISKQESGKLRLGLPASPPDAYDGPWEEAEHWVIWLAAAWGLLCLAGTALAYFSNNEFIVYVFSPPDETLIVRMSRQFPLLLLIYWLFGLAVEKGGVNVAITRKASHIMWTFIFPLLLTPTVIEGAQLYREWYLSVTWNSFFFFVIPYTLMVRPIRSKVRILYLGHRCFDRPEDRPYTLIWFMSQMLAVGVILVPMSQYFASRGAWSLYLIAAFASGLGDGLAEPVGKVFGKKKYTVTALFTKREYTRSYDPNGNESCGDFAQGENTVCVPPQFALFEIRTEGNGPQWHPHDHRGRGDPFPETGGPRSYDKLDLGLEIACLLVSLLGPALQCFEDHFV
jgi:phytol kinase